ncbi:MAG: ATP-binding protein [Oscillospiraceae bacterium]|nr:ATP-binding protein [Oscillospiraceae bacterium]
MFECPIVYYEQNLIFDNNNSCWGVFKLNGFDYDTLNEESKLDIHHKLTRLLSTIIDEAKILIIPTVFDLDTHYKQFEKSLDENDVLYDYALNYAMSTKQVLTERSTIEGADSTEYDTYIIVKLVTEDEAGGASGVQGYVEALFKNPVNLIETVMATRNKDIMESRVHRFEKLASAFLAEQDKRIPMRPATATEIQYLLKRAANKGIEHEIRLNVTRKLIVNEYGRKQEIISDWLPYTERSLSKSGKNKVLRPYFRDTINLFQGEIDQKEKRMLKITHNSGETSYQTYMVLSHIPLEQSFPGNEWIYLLQTLNVQGEICVHIKSSEHRQALRELELQTRKIKSQYENITEVGEDGNETIESYQQAKELEEELKSSRTPIIKTCVSICIFGTTPEEVEEKAEFVRSTYSDLKFVWERPVSDQLKLFMQHIPGTGKYIDAFTMPLLPQVLAGGVIGVSNQLGDNIGPYIGTTGKNNKPVFLDMGLACRSNNSASATLFGRLGKGKSFFANLLVVLNVIYGGFALIFDPKGERGEWIKRLPMLKGLINIVTLSSDESNRGKLDPFLVYADDYDRASELAYIVISELYKLSPDGSASLVLTEALDELRHVKKPCMSKLCDILEKSQEEIKELRDAAIKLGRQLKSTRRRGMAALIFGTGNETAISLDNRMNIFQIQNLKMPGPDTPKESYSPDESLSVVMMIILGNIAKRFALVPRNVFSIVLFDESWALGKTAEGRNLYDFLSRMGRSLYCGCIFNGHSVLDIPTEGIKNAITYKFCFNTDNMDEAKRMLEYLDMEVTPENLDIIKELGNGECLFSDLFGRIGVLKVDAIFDDIKAAFDTTPKTKQEADAEAEEQNGEFDDKQADEPAALWEDMFVREVV